MVQGQLGLSSPQICAEMAQRSGGCPLSRNCVGSEWTQHPVVYRRVLRSCDSDCPAVASGRLVSFTFESGSRPSLSVAPMGVAAPPASSPPLSQVYRGTSPSRVETLQRIFRKKDFSQRAARFMALPVRQSSARVY